MKTFDVINVATGEKVYEYRNDVPVEFTGYEFANFEHRMVFDTDAVQPTSTKRYNGRTDLTKYEYRSLFFDSEQLVIDKINETYADMPLPDELKDEIRTALANYESATGVSLLDPRIAKSLDMYIALNAIGAERKGVILNG